MAINKLTVFHLILLPNEPTAQLKLESAITEKVFFFLLYLATTVTSGLLVGIRASLSICDCRREEYFVLLMEHWTLTAKPSLTQ